MHILIGFCLALVLLYFWLLGHWFARVVVFLGLAVVIGFVGFILGASLTPPLPPAPEHVSAPWQLPPTNDPHLLLGRRLLAEFEAAQAAGKPAPAVNRSDDGAMGMAIAERYQLADEANTAANPPQPTRNAQPVVFQVLGALAGIALAWPISGIPIYYRRHNLTAGEKNA